jgi:hypothetical protein
MIQKHILWATFRVVAYIKGDCVELPQFPRISFFGGLVKHVAWPRLREKVEGLGFSDVLWCC